MCVNVRCDLASNTSLHGCIIVSDTRSRALSICSSCYPTQMHMHRPRLSRLVGVDGRRRGLADASARGHQLPGAIDIDGTLL